MAEKLEKVAPGVHRVDGVGTHDAIGVLLIEDNDGLTLIDTGLASSVDRIKEAALSLGAGPGDLKRIFLTHHHLDHVGGLKGVLAWAPGAEVGATAYEADIISGRRDGFAPPPRGPFLRLLLRNQKSPGVPVDRVVREGEFVSGFRVIATPGHTLGHASLLRDSDGLLVTADVFGCLPWTIRVGVRKSFCADPPLSKRSAEKLLGETFTTVVMTHGPVLREDAWATLHRVVKRCRY